MTDVDICNLALGYLGDAATVASIDPPEGSAQAQHCARFYPNALGVMLEAHEWNFATRRVSLAQLTTSYSDRWQYAYQRPSDAKAILTLIPANYYSGLSGSLVSDGGLWSPGLGVWYLPYPFESVGCEGWFAAWRDFQLELDANGRQVILSNMDSAVARYTTSQVQPGMFPALFADALAWRLAAMLAGPLLKGEVGAAESKRCLQMAAAVAAEAMGKDANQRHDAPRPRPVWLVDR